MNRVEFDALVARLDAVARTSPRGYKARLIAMAALGYGYLFAMLALLLLLLAAAAASVVYLKVWGVKLLFVIGPFVWLVARSLWVSVPAPVGIAVTKKQAPELFERLDRLGRELGAPRFHDVIVNDEFNAAVVQVPRLGVFGWHRNILVLGMPLLKALKPEQLDAVLAHELGHLAGGHARFGNWLYRLRTAWSQLLNELARANSRGDVLFRPFLEWYSPRFSAYTFPLARANEYEADAASARVTSPRAAAEALTAVNVVGAYLRERYWPRIHAAADHHPQPAFAPFASLGSFRDDLPEPDAKEWLGRAMAQATTSADTHPALADRLKAIGAAPALAVPGQDESSDRLLGSARERVIAALDERWLKLVMHDWNSRYRDACARRERLAELEEFAARDALTIQDAIERACLIHAHGDGYEAAVALLRDIVERNPDHAIAHYALGVRLLDADDADGAAIMERAIELDPSLTGAGEEALRDHHWRAGNRELAERHHDALEACQIADHAAQAERATIRLSDKYMTHGLDPEALQPLKATLAGLGIRKAWLVRKRCRHQPELPLYVLAFRLTHVFAFNREQRGQAMQERIVSEVTLPGDSFVICVDGTNYRFGRKFRWMRGARIL